MDNYKGIKFIMNFFFFFNENISNLKCGNSFCDKDKLLNLRDKKSLDKHVGSTILNLFTTMLLKTFF